MGHRTHVVALALLLAVPALAVLRAAPDEEEEAEAQEKLERIEHMYDLGRYLDAQRMYTRLARSHPDTHAGRIAAERSLPSGYIGSKLIVDNGPSENRVDFGILGDGFTIEQQDSFDDLADDVPALFERQRTFGEYASYFNFRRFNMVSKDSGVDGFGREEDTALDAFTRDTIQGHVMVDSELVRRALTRAPGNDGLAIVYVRAGTHGTGGKGIATIGGRSAKVTIHELGHAFAGLGDEYAKKTHEREGTSEEVNVSVFEDPTKVPWAHWIEAEVPGVGVYEGANGQVRGAFKPTASGCVMEDGEFFCPPCREEVVLRIHRYVDPIDGATPEPHPRASAESLELTGTLEFAVTVMQPESHDIEVDWWVLPERAAPQEPRSRSAQYASGFVDRRSRGPLSTIQAKPDRSTRADAKGVHELTVRASRLEPGRYRVVCRARDTTEIRGERHPWVLHDEHGLLESERAWWVVVPE